MTDYRYDLFVSYATAPDARLTRQLEQFLEAFHHLKTPQDLTLRALSICRDGSDFSLARLQSGTGRTEAAVDVLIRDYLQQSKQLLVVCSRAARDSEWVTLEIQWFLEHRGAEHILLAISEGVDPGSDPSEVFSPVVIGAGLHTKPWYDFREFRGRAARDWRKVKHFEDETVRLAADLNGRSAGDIQPVWFREQQRSRRRRLTALGSAAVLITTLAAAAWYQHMVARQELGQKLIARAYELLYRDPSAALLKAHQASKLLSGPVSEDAIKAAYKIAVMHHYNRRETAQMTGSGPRYLAGRWKQGEIFASPSPDGRHRLVVTERGADGGDPPGEVYLVNNESLRTVQLASCAEDKRRVESVGFDRSSTQIFVSRQYNVNVHALSGRCVGLIRMSCCTKSPVHLVDGMLGGHYALVAESKGGLSVVDVETPDAQPMVVHPEFHGDAAVSTDLSPDRRRAVVVYESGRVGLVSLPAAGQPHFTEVAKTGALFAAFDPARANHVLTTGADGVMRRFEVNDSGATELARHPIADTAIDFVGFSDDTPAVLAVGANHSLYVVDRETGRVEREIDEAAKIDWAATREVVVEPRSVLPQRIERSQGLPLNAPALAGARVMEAAGHRWLVSTERADGVEKFVTYLVADERGLAYPIVSRDLEAVEQFGELLWLKCRRSWQPGLAGPVIRIDSHYIAYFPGQDLEVTSVVTYEDKLYLGTGHGLYMIAGSSFRLISRDTMQVRGLFPLRGRLWVATRHGGYVLEHERLYRVSDPFADIRMVKEVGGAVWMLTDSTGEDFLSKFGPAYLVDGYMARPYPSPQAKVVDVIAAAGRTWLGANPGLYVMAADRAMPVGNIPEVVTSIDEHSSGVRIGTETEGFPDTSDGPEYEVDIKSLAVRKR